MIRKGLFIIGFIYSVIFTLESCCVRCCDDYGTLNGKISSNINGHMSDSISVIAGAFDWQINFGADYSFIPQIGSTGLYASQPCSIEAWTNFVDTNSCDVWMSRSLTYLNNTLRENTSLWNFLSFDTYSDLEPGFNMIDIQFDSTFMANSEFMTDSIYTIHFEGYTNDSVYLRDSISVLFEL